ncbi:MAG: phenylacetate-CoA oxygenase subunit PaaJ [Burkholderiaceae bacterium]|nr:phenylacetate-CoA oxygenase subunit PaaJ [Burkholderiaceae bacterium]
MSDVQAASPAIAVGGIARVERAWQVLAGVPDPEVPAVSVCDLGIVREVIDHGDGLEVVLTPTYSGCPATEAIESDVLAALEAAGLGPARATLRRAPAWTSDWFSEEGRRKLAASGIAPPGPVMRDEDGSELIPIRLVGRAARAGRAGLATIACPRCGSSDTEQLSAFGSTACKALYRCRACREPFELFKPF